MVPNPQDESRPAPQATPDVPDRPRARPFLPPPSSQLADGAVGPMRSRPGAVLPRSSIHFLVHPDMSELRALADAEGWFARGWTSLEVTWVELRYTTDGWRSMRTLRSTDVPCPIVNGHFFLPDVPAGTVVEFALHVGLGCRAPHDDPGQVRAETALWFNNDGRNFQQPSR